MTTLSVARCGVIATRYILSAFTQRICSIYPAFFNRTNLTGVLATFNELTCNMDSETLTQTQRRMVWDTMTDLSQDQWCLKNSLTFLADSLAITLSGDIVILMINIWDIIEINKILKDCATLEDASQSFIWNKQPNWNLIFDRLLTIATGDDQHKPWIMRKIGKTVREIMAQLRLIDKAIHQLELRRAHDYWLTGLMAIGAMSLVSSLGLTFLIIPGYVKLTSGGILVIYSVTFLKRVHQLINIEHQIQLLSENSETLEQWEIQLTKKKQRTIETRPAPFRVTKMPISV